MQEILLGIGGVRLLRALGVEPSVFHMNEGHAAFLTLELIREKMAGGQNYCRGAGRDEGAMHFHHAHAGGGRARPFHARLMDYALHVTARSCPCRWRTCWAWAAWSRRTRTSRFA
jgi:hypothetical protein